MKHIKIFEEFKQGDLTEEQRKWLDDVAGKGNWKVNREGKIDVHGWVDIAEHTDLKRFPVEFGRVTSHFNCRDCSSLTTLEGCPRTVGGFFSCYNCTSLTTLAGAPEKVEGTFYDRGCIRVPQAERNLLKLDKDLFLQWANSGIKIENFLQQKRGSLKGREFRF